MVTTTKTPRDWRLHLAVYTIATLVSPAYLPTFTLDMQFYSLKFYSIGSEVY